MIYVPYVLFRKEKFYPRFVIRCCVFNGAVILRWFPSNFRSASLDHNSAFFFVPRHCTAHRINRFVSSIPVTFHTNGRIILCIPASLSRVCGWLHERATVVHTSLIKSSHIRVIVNTLFTNNSITSSIRCQSELNRLKTFSRCFYDTLNSDPPFGAALRWLLFSSSDTLGILKYDILAHSSSLQRQHCRSQSSARCY